VCGRSVWWHKVVWAWVVRLQDIDCGNYLPQYLPAAVADGSVPIDLVDTALTHLFLVQYRLGLFDSPSLVPYSNVSTDVICNQAHTDLALSAAQQGIVLLKNDGTLPLSASSVKTVALIGPNGGVDLVGYGWMWGGCGVGRGRGCIGLACGDVTWWWWSLDDEVR